MPKRIQRLRTKGWIAQDGAIYCGRPTVFGNPFRVDVYGLDLSLALFENSVHGIFDPRTVLDVNEKLFDQALSDHRDWMFRIGHHPTETIRRLLAGKDLMCWCHLSKRCHADILLGVANS